jgi:hypothetical protein
MAGESYEGWANRQTWAAWAAINNDYDLYMLMRAYARRCMEDQEQPSYDQFIRNLGLSRTGTVVDEKITFGDPAISRAELDEALREEVSEIKRFG